MKLDADGHTLLVDLNSAALDGLHKGDHQLANITYEVSDGDVTVNNSVSLDIIGTADQYKGSVSVTARRTHTTRTTVTISPRSSASICIPMPARLTSPTAR